MFFENLEANAQKKVKIKNQNLKNYHLYFFKNLKANLKKSKNEKPKSKSQETKAKII